MLNFSAKKNYILKGKCRFIFYIYLFSHLFFYFHTRTHLHFIPLAATMLGLLCRVQSFIFFLNSYTPPPSPENPKPTSSFSSFLNDSRCGGTGTPPPSFPQNINVVGEPAPGEFWVSGNNGPCPRWVLHTSLPSSLITINIPLLYIGREIIFFLRGNPLRGPLQGVVQENRDF